MRHEESLFRSLKQAVDILHLRQNALRDEYLKYLAINLGKQVVEVDCDTPPPNSMTPPYVAQLQHAKDEASKTVLPPEECQMEDREALKTFRVPAPMGHFANEYTVTPDLLAKGNYDEACSCGACATVTLFCKHVNKCIEVTRSDWKYFMKYWLQVCIPSLRSLHISHHIPTS